MLHNYFNIPSKDLGGHAFQKNWHKQRAGIENPERKRIIRQMIEDETWKVVMKSKSEGQAKDKLGGLKLLGEMEGLGMGTKEKDQQPVNIGRIINLRFSLNDLSEQQRGRAQAMMDQIRKNLGLPEVEAEPETGFLELIPDQHSEEQE